MRYPEREAISYPFSVYYHGYLGDLGSDPVFFANVFDDSTDELIDVPSLVEMVEIVQVSNDVLFVGNVYINKLDTAPIVVGTYHLKLSVSTPSGIIDLLYAPIEVIPNDHVFRISFSGEENITSESINAHFREVITPGVKVGFHFIPGSQSYSFDITRGVLFTEHGVKIEHSARSTDAVTIDPAGPNGRVDIVTVFYNPRLFDEQGAHTPPQFRVLKGRELAGQSEPPTIPPNHTGVSYALVPPNTGSPSQIKFSRLTEHPGRRPFFNKESMQVGDGVRSRFEFAIKYIEGTTRAGVDGVPQFAPYDYKELPSIGNMGVIEFIGEVPQPGQKVTLTGAAIAGAFFEHDYTLYSPPESPTPPVVTTYPRAGLVSEFVAENYVEGLWPDTESGSPGFANSPSVSPYRGWGQDGHYVYFDGTHILNSLPGISGSNWLLPEFTIVLLGDLRDSTTSGNWMRLLTKPNGSGHDFSLVAVNNAPAPSLRLVVGDGSPVVISPTPAQWTDSTFKIVCTRSASGAISLSYNDVSGAGTAGPYIASGDDWTLGREEGTGAGTGFEGKLFLVLIYDRVLSQLEIDSV